MTYFMMYTNNLPSPPAGSEAAAASDEHSWTFVSGFLVPIGLGILGSIMRARNHIWDF